MRKRYYKRYRRYSPSVFEMLLEIFFSLFIWLIKFGFKLIYRMFNLLLDKFHETRINKKAYSNIQEETEKIPETEFKEDEEEKEIYLPYRKKQFLMTRAEYAFNKILEQIVGDKYYVGRQVLLSNLVEVTSTYKPYRSKIDKKTVDFVLFNKAGYTPYLAIELDDSSHNRLDRMQRDRFVEDVLGKAGIRIVRIKNAYDYDVDDITNKILI